MYPSRTRRPHQRQLRHGCPSALWYMCSRQAPGLLAPATVRHAGATWAGCWVSVARFQRGSCTQLRRPHTDRCKCSSTVKSYSADSGTPTYRPVQMQQATMNAQPHAAGSEHGATQGRASRQHAAPAAGQVVPYPDVPAGWILSCVQLLPAGASCVNCVLTALLPHPARDCSTTPSSPTSCGR